MIKNFTLTFFMVLASLGVSAQVLDWDLSVPPYGRNAFDVFITDSGRVFMFGGSPSNDSISTIAFTYNGVNWDVKMDKVNSPVLNNAHFINADTAVVVGEVGMVLRSTDGGMNWTKISVPSGVSRRKFKSVYFTDNLTGYIVGGNPSNDSITTILKTTDGGLNWSILKDGLGAMLNDVYFINSDTGFAVGEHGLMLKTTNAGNSWSEVTLSGNVKFRTLTGVYFNTASNGFAYGGHPTNDSIQTILNTKDGGSNWSIVTDRPNPMVQDVSFHNDKKGLMVGNNGLAKETTDGGETWVDVVLPNVNDQWFFTSVHYLNDSTAIIGGRNGAVFLSFDSTSHLTTGVKKNQIADFGIYPNPVKDYFTFDSKGSPSFEIFNASGKLISDSKYDIIGNKVMVSGLPRGVYYVRWTNGKSIMFNHKLVLQ